MVLDTDHLVAQRIGADEVGSHVWVITNQGLMRRSFTEGGGIVCTKKQDNVAREMGFDQRECEIRKDGPMILEVLVDGGQGGAFEGPPTMDALDALGSNLRGLQAIGGACRTDCLWGEEDGEQTEWVLVRADGGAAAID
jgi:hypothetical protein